MTDTSVKGPKVSRHLNTMKGHSNLVSRLRKSLYYGSLNSGTHERIDHPSMPLTELTVDLFERTVTSGPKGLDVFDMNYAAQVSRQACISPTSIMLAMIYLERLKTKNPEYLRRVSTCDLFLVSIMIASKFLFDDGEEDEVFNDEWAASADIDVKQLNRLEREFLKAMDWSLFVDCETFLKQLSKVEAILSLNESRRRGAGMTYNEILVLYNANHFLSGKSDHLWAEVMTAVSKVLVLSCLAYWATILALMTSTAIARTSLQNTRTLVNQSLASNESAIVYSNGLPPALTWNGVELTLECDPKAAKTQNIVFIQNRISYNRKTNFQFTSKQNILNSRFDSMPKKYSFNYYYKY